MFRRISHTILILGLSTAATSICRADSLIGNFTILNGVTGNPSVGQVTFTLNGDGTIAASLATTGINIVGFGVDSSGGLPESGFAPTTDPSPTSWFDPDSGQYSTGFVCSTTPCGPSETWTIGSLGEFTSTGVFGALGGGTALFDFYLTDGVSNFEAVAVATPEPAAALPILIGLVGLTIVRRRRKRNSSIAA